MPLLDQENQYPYTYSSSIVSMAVSVPYLKAVISPILPTIVQQYVDYNGVQSSLLHILTGSPRDQYWDHWFF